MFDRRQALMRSLPALAVLGFAGAWLAADYFRVGAYDTASVSRGALLALGTLSALVAGAVGAAPRSRIGAVLAAGLGTAALCAVVEVVAEALTADRAIVSRPAWMSARDGLVASAAFVVPVVAICLAARRPWARPRSLVGGVDARSLWMVPALGVAIGAPVAVRGCSSSRCFAVPLDVTLALSALAVLWLGATFALDLDAYLRGRRAAAGSELLEVGDPEADSAASMVDFGVGEGEAVKVERSDAYRSRPRVVGGVRGEPWSGMRVLRLATLKSATAVLIGFGAMSVAFTTAAGIPKATPAGIAFDASHELDKVLNGSDLWHGGARIPLVCETYFTMAGGCVDRLPSRSRERAERRLDRVREEWVTGSAGPHGSNDGFDLERACATGLDDLLGERACATDRREASDHRDSGSMGRSFVIGIDGR